MAILVYSYAALQLADMLTTLAGLSIGCVEKNPLYYSLGLPLFFGLKVAVVFFAFGVARFVSDLFPLPLLKHIAFVVIVVGTLAIVVWNLAMIALALVR